MKQIPCIFKLNRILESISERRFGKYLLYHRNSHIKGMEFWEAVNGNFHRQSDVKATESMEKIVEYIVAHDRAKVTIMDDYRKLPTSTKKQKQYFKSAKRKADRKASRRLDSLFLMIEIRKALKIYHTIKMEKTNMKTNKLLNEIYYEQKATNRNLQKLMQYCTDGNFSKDN